MLAVYPVSSFNSLRAADAGSLSLASIIPAGSSKTHLFKGILYIPIVISFNTPSCVIVASSDTPSESLVLVGRLTCSHIPGFPDLVVKVVLFMFSHFPAYIKVFSRFFILFTFGYDLKKFKILKNFGFFL